MRQSAKAVLSFEDLMGPVLKVLLLKGGQATTSDIRNLVAAQITTDGNQGKEVSLASKIAWAKNLLKQKGLVSNPRRGNWILTQKGRGWARAPLPEDSPRDVDRLNVTGKAFERFCQKYLRRAGFSSVRVVGKSGDGGIDGYATYDASPHISFRLAFQCKGLAGTVSARLIREFRGAVSGRADKGLFMTTGRFTRGAAKEAARRPAIVLIDGRVLENIARGL